MQRIKSFLSTFHLLMIFCGYELVTMIFLSPTSQGNTQLITLPYRGFMMLFAIVLIAITGSNRGKVKTIVTLFLVYWLFFLLRMFYDLHINPKIYISDITSFWLLVFSLTIIPLITTYRTFRLVRMDKILWWYFFFSSLALLISVLKMEDTSGMIRQAGNIALNSISYANLGLSLIILSIFILYERGISKTLNLLVFLMLLFAIYCLFIAGSRGPLASLFIIGTIWYFLRSGNFLGFFITVIVISIITTYLDGIISLIGQVSPILESRFSDTLTEGDTSRRKELSNFAWRAFLDSPIFGKQFGIFENNNINYPHNILLEGFMALGLGGFLLLFVSLSALIKACRLILMRNKNYWLSLLFLQHLINSFISGSIYFTPMLSVTILLVHLLEYKKEDVVHK